MMVILRNHCNDEGVQTDHEFSMIDLRLGDINEILGLMEHVASLSALISREALILREMSFRDGRVWVFPMDGPEYLQAMMNDAADNKLVVVAPEYEKRVEEWAIKNNEPTTLQEMHVSAEAVRWTMCPKHTEAVISSSPVPRAHLSRGVTSR